MPFLPAAQFRPTTLDKVEGPALFYSTQRGGEVFYVGPGENAWGIFLDGAHAGHAFQVAQGGNWAGIAVREVEVEVDFAQIDTEGMRVPYLTLKRKGSELGAFVSVRGTQGFNDTVLVPVVIGLDPVAGQDQPLFTTWRIVKRDKGKVLLTHDVTLVSQR